MKGRIQEYFEEHLERSTYLQPMDPQSLLDEGIFHTALLMVAEGLFSLEAFCLASAGAMVILERIEEVEDVNN